MLIPYFMHSYKESAFANNEISFTNKFDVCSFAAALVYNIPQVTITCKHYHKYVHMSLYSQ